MRRSTIVMLVVLALLAGLYWYLRQPENAIQRALQGTPTATKVDLGNVISIDQGSPSRITIERKDGKSIRLDQSTGLWMLLTAEGSIPAEPTAADSASTAVAALRILSKLDPAPDPATIGLDKPEYAFSVVLSNGVETKFEVGEKTVTQSGYYVRSADGSIYVVGVNNLETLIALIDSPPLLQTPTP